MHQRKPIRNQGYLNEDVKTNLRSGVSSQQWHNPDISAALRQSVQRERRQRGKSGSRCPVAAGGDLSFLPLTSARWQPARQRTCCSRLGDQRPTESISELYRYNLEKVFSSECQNQFKSNPSKRTYSILSATITM